MYGTELADTYFESKTIKLVSHIQQASHILRISVKTNRIFLLGTLVQQMLLKTDRWTILYSIQIFPWISPPFSHSLKEAFFHPHSTLEVWDITSVLSRT